MNNLSLFCNFSENVFVPNSAVNLNELGTEEREIETFKRFNYFYDPPKNKPKVNLDVTKMVKKPPPPPPSNNPSPYFGDLVGPSSRNTPRLDGDHSPELNAFKPNNCDPTTINNLDNFLHGIIGEELNNDHN